MNRSIIIRLFVLFTVCSNELYGQETKNNTADAGVFLYSSNRIYKATYFDKYSYIYYKKPLSVSKSKDNGFSKSQLATPVSVLQAYTVSNTVEWRKSLFDGRSAVVITDKTATYMKSKSFQDNYKLDILAEFKFTYENRDYDVVLANTLTGEGNYLISSFLTVKTPDGWKMSSNLYLTLFSQYMYFKPEVMQAFLTGDNSVQGNDLTKYFSDGLFDVYSEFSLDYVKRDKIGGSILKSTMPFDSIYDAGREIKVEYGNNENAGIKAGVNKAAIISRMDLYKYEGTDNWCFSRDGCWKDEYSKYDSLPEMAMASWLFSKSMDEKKKHSLGFEQIAEQTRKYLEEGSNYGRIQWKHKIVFYDAHEDKYALIYFSEWYGKSTSTADGEGGALEKWIGDKSILLKHVDGSWLPVFDVNEEVMALVRAFDMLSLEGLTLLFSGKTTGKRDVDFYLRGNFLAYPPDGRIYMNQLFITTPKYNSSFTLPEEFKREWPILGPVDRYRKDDLLPYWMDRKN